MYKSFYGLRLNPFENTPDPRFLFPSKSHREILASLRYGVENSKGFILIAGDIGTGKTTMIYALLRRIDSSYIVININNPKWTFSEIISYLAAKLEVNIEGKDNFQILDRLQIKLEKLDYLGKRLVLIIDEAHLLSVSTLEDIRLISNIEKENKKLIQIVLVGQKEIYQTLQKDSLKTLKQRILINRELKPLDQKETRHYIEHRLRVAGTNTNPFDTRAMTLIWRKSKGTPRVINHICDNAMLIGFAEEKKTIGARIVKEVVKDMETGHKQPRSYFGRANSRYGWLVGCALVILIILAAVYAKSKRPALLKEILPKFPISAQEQEKTQPEPEIIPKAAPAPIEAAQQKASANLSGQQELSAQLQNEPIPQPTETEKETAVIAENDQPAVAPTTAKVMLKLPQLGEIRNENISNASALHNKQKKVMPKDYLYKIVLEEYGIVNDTVLDIIQIANPEIKDLNLIFAGQTIHLPQIRRQDLIVKDPSGRFHIHYASHYKYEDAQITRQNLLDQSIKAFVLPSVQGNNTVYRVYCGNFKTRNEAEEKLKTLEFKQLRFID